MGVRSCLRQSHTAEIENGPGVRFGSLKNRTRAVVECGTTDAIFVGEVLNLGPLRTTYNPAIVDMVLPSTGREAVRRALPSGEHRANKQRCRRECPRKSLHCFPTRKGVAHPRILARILVRAVCFPAFLHRVLVSCLTRTCIRLFTGSSLGQIPFRERFATGDRDLWFARVQS